MSEISMEPCPFCKNTQIDYWDETDGFFYCEKCGLCGPRAHDKILAADRWNGLPRREEKDIYQPLSFHPGLPRRLKWTKEKPKENGFYWWRDGNKHLLGIICVCVEQDSMAFGSEVGSLSKCTGEFAGPIPEPEEP